MNMEDIKIHPDSGPVKVLWWLVYEDDGVYDDDFDDDYEEDGELMEPGTYYGPNFVLHINPRD